MKRKKIKLDVSNVEHMIYNKGELGFSILGGIKLEGLDRMRATLKVIVVKRDDKRFLNNPEYEGLAVRHSFDLYNDIQVEKFVRKVSTKLEVGQTVIEECLSDITNQLEAWRLGQTEGKEQEKTEQPLAEKEREETLEFLKAPNLLERINDLIGKSGVVGEEQNRLLMYLIFTSRKRKEPLHIVSLGSSGTGKTHLQEKIAELLPDYDKIAITSLSENAFYYFGVNELRNKLILIEDLDGLSGQASNGGGGFFALRELQSKKSISKTVVHKDSKGRTKTIHLKVEGPVTVAGCTTKESIYEDNANRSFLIYIDESPEQDECIMDYQRRKSAGLINEKEEEQAKKVLQNIQRLLLHVEVINPYATQLKLPKEVFKRRRSNAHYLQFIELITFIHQYQREFKKGENSNEEYIETTVEDIKQANELIKHILLRKSDVLTGACRNYFELLKVTLKKHKQTRFTNREMSQKLRKSLPTIKRHHQKLFNAGLLCYLKDQKTRTHYYEVANHKDYMMLKMHVSQVLDHVLKDLGK